MSHALTLTVPDELYEAIRRNAQASNQPPESMVLRSLGVSLPSLDGLPRSVAEDLAQLAALDDEALLGVMREVVGDDAGDVEEIESLLEKHREGALADGEAERLDVLCRAANRTMLRKARAAALLRFRGRPVPVFPRG
jgi:hypothetical protein